MAQRAVGRHGLVGALAARAQRCAVRFASRPTTVARLVPEPLCLPARHFASSLADSNRNGDGDSATLDDSCDVLVVGGGHAGCESAHAAARLGARTILVTSSAATIGTLSCNPSMGGIGKATLIREIDSLGGLMGRIADRACIQFRLLNTSKGPAVHGPRMQLDRDLYRREMQKEILHNTPNLRVIEGSVDDLMLEENPGPTNRRVAGVVLSDGQRIRASSVVLTTGTFLAGKMLLGRTVTAGGRRSEGGTGAAIEPPATKLALTLKRCALPVSRMRTGTPPRLEKASIDFDQMDEQLSHPVQPFSFLHSPESASPSSYINPNPLLPCFRTSTTAETHRHVLESIATGEVPSYESRATLARGAASNSQQDDSNAPRYCPSLENKCTRFATRAAHSIILEPEGVDSEVYYPQGLEISSSEVYQERIVRSIRGLSRARLLALGYAVEYDYLDPLAAHPWLESRLLRGLFLAGQINGTTGYEEAAAQGILAGINAAKLVPAAAVSSSTLAPTPFILPRSSSFIGTLISDLTRVGVLEPYRMFTSRSEYRLHLRADNADRRLTRLAMAVGSIAPTDERVRRLETKERRLAEGAAALQEFKQPKAIWHGIMQQLAQGVDLFTLPSSSARSSESGVSAASFIEGAPLSFTLRHLSHLFSHVRAQLHPAILGDLEVDMRYRVHIARQQREIETLASALQTNEGMPIVLPHSSAFSPAHFSHEDYDKLVTHQPRTVADAHAIGLSPTALARLIAQQQRTSPAGTPPAPRLVGIELNPGPTDEKTAVVIASASSLVTDGLHSIYSFLLLVDRASALVSCQHWLAAARSEPPRDLPLLDCSLALLTSAANSTSPLNRHVTRVVNAANTVITPALLFTALCALPHLRECDVRVCDPASHDADASPSNSAALGPELTTLTINFCSNLGSTPAAVIRALPDCPALTSLEMVLDTCAEDVLEPLSRCTQLVRLKLTQFNVTNLCLGRDENGDLVPEAKRTHLHSIAAIPALTDLSLGSFRDLAALLDLGIAMPRLREFGDLSQIEDGTMTRLYELMPNLTSRSSEPVTIESSPTNSGSNPSMLARLALAATPTRVASPAREWSPILGDTDGDDDHVTEDTDEEPSMIINETTPSDFLAEGNEDEDDDDSRSVRSIHSAKPRDPTEEPPNVIDEPTSPLGRLVQDGLSPRYQAREKSLHIAFSAPTLSLPVAAASSSSMPPLTLVLLGARNLRPPPGKVAATLIDPYVSVTALWSGRKCKSRVIKHSAHPMWNQRFSIAMPAPPSTPAGSSKSVEYSRHNSGSLRKSPAPSPSLSALPHAQSAVALSSLPNGHSPTPPGLRFRVYHKELFGKVLLGEALLSLDELQRMVECKHDVFVPLSLGAKEPLAPGQAQPDRGDLHLILTIDPLALSISALTLPHGTPSATSRSGRLSVNNSVSMDHIDGSMLTGGGPRASPNLGDRRRSRSQEISTSMMATPRIDEDEAAALAANAGTYPGTARRGLNFEPPSPRTPGTPSSRRALSMDFGPGVLRERRTMLAPVLAGDTPDSSAPASPLRLPRPNGPEDALNSSMSASADPSIILHNSYVYASVAASPPGVGASAAPSPLAASNKSTPSRLHPLRIMSSSPALSTMSATSSPAHAQTLGFHVRSNSQTPRSSSGGVPGGSGGATSSIRARMALAHEKSRTMPSSSATSSPILLPPPRFEDADDEKARPNPALVEVQKRVETLRAEATASNAARLKADLRNQQLLSQVSALQAQLSVAHEAARVPAGASVAEMAKKDAERRLASTAAELKTLQTAMATLKSSHAQEMDMLRSRLLQAASESAAFAAYKKSSTAYVKALQGSAAGAALEAKVLGANADALTLTLRQKEQQHAVARARARRTLTTTQEALEQAVASAHQLASRNDKLAEEVATLSQQVQMVEEMATQAQNALAEQRAQHQATLAEMQAFGARSRMRLGLELLQPLREISIARSDLARLEERRTVATEQVEALDARIADEQQLRAQHAQLQVEAAAQRQQIQDLTQSHQILLDILASERAASSAARVASQSSTTTWQSNAVAPPSLPSQLPVIGEFLSLPLIPESSSSSSSWSTLALTMLDGNSFDAPAPLLHPGPASVPAPRLVGIELNPGPKEQSKSPGASLFKDGLLSIFSFLTLADVTEAGLVSRS